MLALIVIYDVERKDEGCVRPGFGFSLQKLQTLASVITTRNYLGATRKHVLISSKMDFQLNGMLFY